MNDISTLEAKLKNALRCIHIFAVASSHTKTICPEWKALMNECELHFEDLVYTLNQPQCPKFLSSIGATVKPFSSQSLLRLFQIDINSITRPSDKGFYTKHFSDVISLLPYLLTAFYLNTQKEMDKLKDMYSLATDFYDNDPMGDIKIAFRKEDSAFGYRNVSKAAKKFSSRFSLFNPKLADDAFLQKKLLELRAPYRFTNDAPRPKKVQLDAIFQAYIFSIFALSCANHDTFETPIDFEGCFTLFNHHSLAFEVVPYFVDKETIQLLAIDEWAPMDKKFELVSLQQEFFKNDNDTDIDDKPLVDMDHIHTALSALTNTGFTKSLETNLKEAFLGAMDEAVELSLLSTLPFDDGLFDIIEYILNDALTEFFNNSKTDLENIIKEAVRTVTEEPLKLVMHKVTEEYKDKSFNAKMQDRWLLLDRLSNEKYKDSYKENIYTSEPKDLPPPNTKYISYAHEKYKDAKVENYLQGFEKIIIAFHPDKCPYWFDIPNKRQALSRQQMGERADKKSKS